jgi:hypothetical protein
MSRIVQTDGLGSYRAVSRVVPCPAEPAWARGRTSPYEPPVGLAVLARLIQSAVGRFSRQQRMPGVHRGIGVRIGVRELVSVHFNSKRNWCQFLLMTRCRLAGLFRVKRRPPCAIGDGLVYLALNRRNNRADLFGDDADRLAFIGALAKTRDRCLLRHSIQCAARCEAAGHSALPNGWN